MFARAFPLGRCGLVQGVYKPFCTKRREGGIETHGLSTNWHWHKLTVAWKSIAFSTVLLMVFLPRYLIGTFHSGLFSSQWLNLLLCLFTSDLLCTLAVYRRLQDYKNYIKCVLVLYIFLNSNRESYKALVQNLSCCCTASRVLKTKRNLMVSALS